MASGRGTRLEQHTARLTLLIDPRKKAVFERLCAEQDVTPSQMVRHLIRSYIERRLGRPWDPDTEVLARGAGRADASAGPSWSARQRTQRR